MRNFGDALVGESATGEVFAGQRAFGRAELLLEPGCRDLVQLDQLGALAALGGFLRAKRIHASAAGCRI